MELQHLKTFTTVVKMGSFSKAAVVLNYAQSSISSQVQALEHELETKLFERLGGEIGLTEDGKRLLIYAEQLLKLAEETKESISGTATPKGTLTIGAPESLSVFRLPTLIQKYRQHFPEVKLVLKSGNSCNVQSWLGKNLIDIAFLVNTPILDDNLITKTIMKEPVTLIAYKGHPLSKRNCSEPKDIAGENLIFVEENNCCIRIIFEDQLAHAGVKPESILELGNIEAIKKCVINGLGVSILPSVTVEEELAHGLVEDLHWNCLDFNIYTQMTYHKDKWISPALAALMDLAEEIRYQTL